MTTSHSSEGNSIQLDVVELFLLVHLPEELTNLIDAERHTLSKQLDPLTCSIGLEANSEYSSV